MKIHICILKFVYLYIKLYIKNCILKISRNLDVKSHAKLCFTPNILNLLSHNNFLQEI